MTNNAKELIPLVRDLTEEVSDLILEVKKLNKRQDWFEEQVATHVDAEVSYQRSMTEEIKRNPYWTEKARTKTAS